jgi:dienelactone hydrolase
MVSGCSGFADARFPTTYASRAAELVRDGFVVGYVDYLAAQGITSACSTAEDARGQPVITLQQVGAYVLAAAADFRLMQDVQDDRVFAVGWSLGGGGVLAALSLGSGSSQLAGAVAFFPVCRDVPTWSDATPALLLLGDLDNIQPPEFCRQLAKNLPATARTTIRSYAKAHHGFDVAELPVITEPQPGPTLGHNPEARAAAWTEMREFLKR